MKKNILITGGAGYIGSHTANAFLRRGHNVVILDDLSAGYIEAVPKEAKFIKGDIHDIRLMEDTLLKNKIDGVIHFAAKIIVPESLERPLDYYFNNTGGVMAMLLACQNTGVSKIVFSSTAAVYGDAGSHLINETFPVKAINPYGRSKYFSECIIRDTGVAHGIKNVILRYFNVAGASSDGSNGQRSKVSTHLIKLAAEAALGVRTHLDITGTDFETPDGTGIRDYIHVEDLADVHIAAFEYLEAGGLSDVFNCGYGRGYSVREVISTIKKVSGVNFKIIETHRRPGDAASLVADNKKLLKTLDWKPKRDNLELICKSAYEWEAVWQKKLREKNHVNETVFPTIN